MAEIAALNEEYGIPGKVSFKGGSGGLPLVELASDQGRAVVALQGGQLIDWTPRDQVPVIWLSREAVFAPGKSLRGGVPVCWPWFGPHPREAAFPAHGFARIAPWRVEAAEAAGEAGTRLSLRLEQTAANRRYWPHSAELAIHISLGEVLEMELVTRNSGATPIAVGEALHTYFAVGDVRRIAIHGLEDGEYLDKVDGGKRKRQDGPLRFNGETDRIYVDTVGDCLIDDPGLDRRIRISKRGSRSTVVWNPWAEKAAKMGDLGEEGYLRMVCVESANAADDVISIAPGDEHRLGVVYRLEPLTKRKP